MAFEVLDQNITQLFKNDDIFFIPRYQRNYVWGELHWGQLIKDIRYCAEVTPDWSHFIGSMVLEAQWRQLPDYVAQETNAIVIADVSGSMSGRPLATSIGLAIYFAERNRGAYHNLFMTFSQKPEFVSLRGETLLQKIKYVERTEWGMNTNLQAAFERVLETAMDHDVPPEEMPKALIVVSDMEIDRCGDRNWMFYDHMKEKYEYCGYQLPNIIFWNVDSRNDIFHADSRRKGVQLYSGQSVTTFQNLLNNIDSTPVKSMEKVIESERYACVRTGNAA